MTDDVRADARRLLQDITPGPWFVDIVPKTDGRIFVGNRADGREHGLWEIVYENGDDLGDLKEEAARREVANAEFIAASPTVVARLLAELDRTERSRDMFSEAYRAIESLLDDRDIGRFDETTVSTIRRKLDDLTAANATLARIQAVAADVDSDLARHILNIIGGES